MKVPPIFVKAEKKLRTPKTTMATPTRQFMPTRNVFILQQSTSLSAKGVESDIL